MTPGGRLFQRRIPATGNPRFPTLESRVCWIVLNLGKLHLLYKDIVYIYIVTVHFGDFFSFLCITFLRSI